MRRRRFRFPFFQILLLLLLTTYSAVKFSEGDGEGKPLEKLKYKRCRAASFRKLAFSKVRVNVIEV